MTKITPPLKWHGGKHYMAKDIVAMMPPHVHYVEPYFGGGAVMLAKNPEGVSEVANDIHGELMNFWRVLKNPAAFAEFQRTIEATPFSETEFNTAPSGQDGRVGHAVKFFVRCRQSMAGRMTDFAPLSRTRTRRGMNEQASAWITSVDGLYAVHARLRRVAILNRPALACIETQDGDETLFYCDPPYLKETRTAPDVYAHEMTRADHAELLRALSGIAGAFLLSGYRSDLYDTAARIHGWNRRDFDLPNNAAGGGSKRRMVECIWSNF